jgi:hypothetical protein
VRVPAGFINASGVGRGAMVETGLLEELSSVGSLSNGSFSAIGEFVAVVLRLEPALSALEDPQNENLVLEIGTLKFGAILESLFLFDGAAEVSLRVSSSMSLASSA